ncbi:MAG TPA: glycosyl hydrolase family 28 protein [Candidatus Acidoferrales bacterium]|jgi:polygalacturonase|nr:glycosyl hydrolase family 28 protein [Candidatus Acidoferrales bacterium]
MKLSATNAVLAAVIGFAGLKAAAAPTLPHINTNNVIVITNSPPLNAVGDGVTDNTLAISNAIVKAAAGGITNGAAGGTVEIPPGIFMCGPLAMKSAVNLQLDAGAILRMLPFGQYPGSGNPNGAAVNFIGATNVNDVEISGSGAIDGQGTPYWHALDTNSAFLRPIMIRLQGCNRQLIQNVTLSNSPMFHISISSSKGNATVQGVTILAPSSSASPQPSHNTDACDVSGTNVLVQNCNISVGDDDFTCGGGTHDVLITNNTYGNGHGISIGSFTDSGGVSNITVVNCTINGADNGIRIKSDNDRGGLVQNISYLNIGITNVHFPIQIYSYYNEVGTPSSITPTTAATENVPVITNNLTPIYRNITFSNITATSVSGYPVGIIWARTEMPATNIIFNKVNVTGDRNFCLYNVNGAQFIDCNLKVSSSTTTFALFDAQAVITNSTPTNTPFTFDGLTANGYGNTLAFYNASGSLKNTNVIDDGPLTLAASTLTVSNNLMLFTNTVLNFTLGTNASTVVVKGNLALGGTNNISAGAGFTNGVYTLLTYTGALSGSGPQLGSVPAGYNYIIDTGTAGQVNLDVTLPAPPAPTNLVAIATNLLINLKWNSVGGATSYNLKRGTVNNGPYPTTYSVAATNYADTAVSNAVSYFYVVTAVAGGESTNSAQVSAVPLPSSQPTNLVMQAVGNQLQLSWPQDHLGWRLQIQTNDLSTGLGTNWATVPNSANIMATNIVVSPTNGGVFLRLVYP